MLKILKNLELAEVLELFMAGFKATYDKVFPHLDNQQATFRMFKFIRVFDPRKPPVLSRNFNEYAVLPGIDVKYSELLLEWVSYWNSETIIDAELDLAEYWGNKCTRWPKLANVPLNCIWIPPSAAGVEGHSAI